MQDAMLDEPVSFEEFARHGVGQITRFYGTAPVEPAAAARLLRERQRWLVEQTRPGIAALVHEECLTGLAAWQATTFPAPLSWGASFDPELVAGDGPARSARRWPRSACTRGWHRCSTWCATRGGAGSRSASPRTRTWSGPSRAATCAACSRPGSWPRSSTSSGTRTRARAATWPRCTPARASSPTCCWCRSRWPCWTPGSARSCTPTPRSTGCPSRPTGACSPVCCATGGGSTASWWRTTSAIAFLASLHGVAADLADAAGQALRAGMDVELPTGNAYLAPLAASVRSGDVPVELVDRAVARVLRQKAALGLLDATFEGEAPDPGSLDPAEHRALAGRLAEEAVILLANDGALPLARTGRVAVIGPNAHRPTALFGCYSFANHVLDQFPDVPLGLEVPTVLEALCAELPGLHVEHAAGLRRRRPGPLGLRGRRARRGGGRRGSARGRRPRGAVRAGDLGRGLRRGLARAARRAARARRARAGDRHPGGPGGRDRPPVRTGLGARAVRGRGPGVLPGRGGCRGGRRGAQRAGQPVGPAAGEHAALGRVPAVLVPAPAARRAVLGVRPGQRAGTPLRVRAVLHDVHPQRPAGPGRPGPHRRDGRGHRAGGQHRRPRRAPTSSSSTRTTRSRRSPGRWPSCWATRASCSSRASRPRWASRCRPPGWRSAAATWCAPSSPGPSSCGSGRRAPSARRRPRSTWSGRAHPVTVADPRWVTVDVRPAADARGGG